ncbi:MAG: hypothetical protein JNM39_17865 [Bdellovibrionaceae bacterium]|nr:hypothetical protein [Pseudobdellovibrionaceae bacterium]
MLKINRNHLRMIQFRGKQLLRLTIPILLGLGLFQNCGQPVGANDNSQIRSGTMLSEFSSELSLPTKHTICELYDGGTLADLRAAISANCLDINTVPGAHVTLEAPNGAELIIPDKVKLRFQGGALWTIQKGIKIHLMGDFSVATERRQFFNGPGQIISHDTYDGLGCPILKRVVFPEWFGAIVNDGADDSVAILKALAFGNFIAMAGGIYDVRNRLPLLRHQTISGAGKSVTRINQMATANLIQYSAPGNPGHENWTDISLQDFIISLTSDCSRVEHLSILGHEVPNDTSSLSNVKAKFGIDPLISGIQISSHYGWRAGEPPVKNVAVNDVEVFKALSICLNIQSDRGARDVLIDGLTCTARTNRPNTAGLSIEAFHPTAANHYENITVKNSTFNGGIWGFYIAGVKNFVADNVRITMQPGGYQAVLWYASDSGHTTTGSIKNSSITFDAPSGQATSLIDVNARGFAKDRDGIFPYLIEVGSSLSIENCTLSSAEYGVAKLIPLLKDSIGVKGSISVVNSKFIGGSYAILADNERDPESFGATVYIASGNPSVPTTIRDVTNQEISNYRLKHSDFEITSSQFYRQAMTAIRAKAAAIKVKYSLFSNIGVAPSAAGFGIIDLRGLSSFDLTGNYFFSNSYSTINNSMFVRAPGHDRIPIIYEGNIPYQADGSSKPISQLGGLVNY